MSRLALLSVSDKTGVVDFARVLSERHGYQLLSTGGTAQLLREAGLPVREVSEHTQFPEMMGGRLKTLHPMIHGGILCRREEIDDLEAAQKQDIDLIDIVAVNLYPFVETINRPEVTRQQAIEQIDIGGPAMLRSAAKNHVSVLPVCDPRDYGRVTAALGDENRLIALRKELAAKVFQHTAAYDGAIATYLAAESEKLPLKGDILGMPDTLEVRLPKARNLRYGENPHQMAALYGDFFELFDVLQGKELSYNNLLDISAAVYLMGEFEKPSAAILKHNNPCGVACGADCLEAYQKALACDTVSAFGGIVILNQTVDVALAKTIHKVFTEIVIAPGFSEEARAVFAKKENLRLLTPTGRMGAESLREVRTIAGGMLVQDRDQAPRRLTPPETKTKRAPTEAEMASLQFAWKVARHVKSNAIVYAQGEQTAGIGAGQMSRVDSARFAALKAEDAGIPLEGAVMASDAFFPFADGIETAAARGITAVIQPGGSKRDAEVIAAADAHGIAMVFTGVRHFRH